MQVKTFCVLGRVSNLPTVWTNVLAAAVISHASLIVPDISQSSNLIVTPSFLQAWSGDSLQEYDWWLFLYTMLSLSLMYVGGMFLNDAFDQHWDRDHGNLRPIVNGDVKGRMVWILGSSLLVVSVIMTTYLYQTTLLDSNLKITLEDFYGFFAGTLLALIIILYNWTHKQFAHASAFLMGACRLGVYIIAALLLSEITPLVILAGMSLLFYIAGLTYLSTNEHIGKNLVIIRYWPLVLLFMPVLVSIQSGYDTPYFWFYLLIFIAWIYRWLSHLLWHETPNIKASIGGLLAAIPLVDGLMLASVQAVIPSLICLLVFLLVPRLHLWVSGT